jgi:hypothetical protein
MTQAKRRHFRLAGGSRLLGRDGRGRADMVVHDLPDPDPHEIHLKMRRGFRPDRFRLAGLRGEQPR